MLGRGLGSREEMGLEPLMSAYIADCEWRGAGGRSGDPEAAARPWKSAICSSRGMTLPEILAAIAILSILFGLLFMPLMKAFGYLHTANTAISVQNSARTLFESVTREISDAIYIYDNCDDPTLASLIVVLPQGAGTNVSQVPSTGSSVPILINPGPGLDYGVNTPVHVHYQIALTRSLERQPDGTMAPASYWNQWEMENPELRDAGLVDIPSPPPADNLYRLFYAEYFLPGSSTPASAVAAFLLPNLLGTLYPAGQPQAFREPGFFEDSLFIRMPRGGATGLCNSPEAAERRRLMEYSGALVGLTPRENVDMATVTYTPATESIPGVWAAKPGVRFESLSVANESLAPVVTGGASYASAYRAKYGHWQTVRRKDWSHPAYGTGLLPPPWARYYQVFDLRASHRYAYPGGTAQRDYYLSIGRTDSVSGVDATDPNHYYVFRLTGPVPPEGVWPATDVPVFNMTLYQERINAFRSRSNEPPLAFWNEHDPYGGNNNALNLLPTSHAEPYWPQMAFLADAERGSVEFRVDAPVRPPEANEPQPPGPLAPFQAPYGTAGDDWHQPAPDGVRADWIIRDVALAKRDAYAGKYNNGDAAALNLGADENTTWLRIPAETMRVMVGHPDPLDADRYVWESYTRATERTLLSRGEFWFDEETGQLSFDPNEAGNWDESYKIRAWYQLQTNVQRRNQNEPVDSTDGHSMTASYFTKEVLRLTLALRAYDADTGRVQPFQLSATVRPRNLR